MLSLLPDLRLSVPEWIGLSAVIIILLSLVLFLSKSITKGWSTGFILFVAAILRVMFLWRSPELSDDIYRYLFDGLILLDVRNPYAAPPADILSDNPFMSFLISHINHPDLPTIYPPSAQFVFAVGAAMGNIFGMKLLLVLLDLSSCALILRLLGNLHLSRSNAVLYAWHPLPIIEIAASGHIDAAALFFTFLTFVCLLAGKPLSHSEAYSPDKTTREISSSSWPWLYGCAAGISFALAVLTKWIPLIFLPGILLLTTSSNRKYAGYGFLISVTAMIGLFWPEVQTCFHTLFIYVANWEFSGFIFRCLRLAAGSGKIARLVIAGGFLAAMGIVYFRCIKAVRPTSLLHRREVFKCFYSIVIMFLFLTPTLHPWYALYLAAFLPFAAGPTGIVFSWSIFLAYRVVILYGLTGQWLESDFIPFLIVIAPASALAAGTIILIATHRPNASDKLPPATN